MSRAPLLGGVGSPPQAAHAAPAPAATAQPAFAAAPAPLFNVANDVPTVNNDPPMTLRALELVCCVLSGGGLACVLAVCLRRCACLCTGGVLANVMAQCWPVCCCVLPCTIGAPTTTTITTTTPTPA